MYFKNVLEQNNENYSFFDTWHACLAHAQDTKNQFVTSSLRFGRTKPSKENC